MHDILSVSVLRFLNAFNHPAKPETDSSPTAEDLSRVMGMLHPDDTVGWDTGRGGWRGLVSR